MEKPARISTESDITSDCISLPIAYHSTPKYAIVTVRERRSLVGLPEIFRIRRVAPAIAELDLVEEMVVPITRLERVLCLVLRRTIVTRKIPRGLDPLGSHNLMKFTAGTSVRRG